VVAGVTTFDDDYYHDDTFGGPVADGLVVRDVRFEGCRFQGSRFHDGSFLSCVFDDCSFAHCDLALVRVVNSSFSGATFTECKVTGVNWSEAAASTGAEPLRFDSCVLDLSVFMGVKLGRVVFRDCSLRHVDFSGADLREADFAGSDLGGARFSRSDLRGARLERAHGYRIDTSDNMITGMRVSLPEAVSLLSFIGVELVASDPD